MSPLWNTARSFWVPEASTDPEFRRLVFIDKIVFMMLALGLMAGVVALGMIATVAIVSIVPH